MSNSSSSDADWSISASLAFAGIVIARSFYALLTLLLIWGTLIWGPAVTLGIVLLLLHLATRVEEVAFLERACERLRRSQNNVMRNPRLLSHPEDIHSVVFLLLTFANYFSAFYIYLRLLETVLAKALFIAGVGTMLGWTAGINLGVVFHNHLHRGSLRNPHLNSWIGRIWTIPSGWPSHFWQYKHTVIHHKHVCKSKDWVQPRTLNNGRYESLYRYILCHWPWRYATRLWREFTGANRRRNRRALREFLIFLLFWLAPFAVDPFLGIGLWLYPRWFGSAFILGTGMYTQHAGGSSDNKYSAPTTFLSEFFNLTMFNVGFHTEHHASPSVHWSELPELHIRLRDELIRGGAHVVPYGSYRAGRLLSSLSDPKGAFEEFRKQHRAYLGAIDIPRPPLK
jgi:fatty acid desaturase